MVHKNEKNEGTKTKAAKATPKPRVASKPKAAARAGASLATDQPAPAKSKPAQAKPKRAEAGSGVRQEDIAVRAYLIAEKRQQLGLPGDSLGDWVEAERQLLGERSANGAN